MSPSPRRALPKAFVAVVAAGLGWTVWDWCARLIASDPLSQYRPRPEDASLPGIELRDFRWRLYEKGRLVAEASVARATVGRDRDRVELFAVTDGRYYASADESFGFRASRAVYEERARTLAGAGGARVWNEDFVLGSEEFRYEGRTDILRVVGPVRGNLHGGDFRADGLELKVRERFLSLGPLAWQGMVNQDGERRRWRFETLDPKGRTTVQGKVTTFGRVRATDGEVIVKAESATYDRQEDVFTARGKVEYFSQEANLSADEVVVHRKERRAVLTGRVVMLVKPREGSRLEEVEIPPLEPFVPDEVAATRPRAALDDTERRRQEERLRTADNLREYPLRVTAQRVEYWYARGARRAVVTGSPQARQDLGPEEWRMLWADRGVWDGERERLRMEGGSGRVRLLNSLGDDLTAAWVEVSTREGEDSMEAESVSGELAIRDDELPDRRPDPPSEAPPGPSLAGRIDRPRA